MNPARNNPTKQLNRMDQKASHYFVKEDSYGFIAYIPFG